MNPFNNDFGIDSERGTQLSAAAIHQICSRAVSFVQCMRSHGVDLQQRQQIEGEKQNTHHSLGCA